MTTDTMIFGTSYIANPEREWLVRQWYNTTRALNPDTFILQVDTPCADYGVVPVFDTYNFETYNFERLQFGDNVGHLMQPDGKDGWGRAFFEGLSFAAQRGVKYVAVIDTDILFAYPVSWYFDMLKYNDYRVIAPRARPHNMLENGLMFMRIDPQMVRQFKEAYDWPNMGPSFEGNELPEQKMQRLLSPTLRILENNELSGCRGEGECVLFPETAAQQDWITHTDRACYEAFLRAHHLGIVT